ncbi:polysaccharide polymerase [Planococcus antarcticus DSM 14505]|uniref:Polysaccharide polymerase n=1 Tax=Planococcus antarcticus DSM 14505 TaxID=1185653 RepID=A0AA87IJ31_9BACL|nr:EpsG family protein [Planococcus antarcticus]EIM05716.1 polysaccharide polymerase [Planococcus antarcticus DSM 14505]
MFYNVLLLFIFILLIFFKFIFKQSNKVKIIFLSLIGILLGLVSALRFELKGDFYANYIGFVTASKMGFFEIYKEYDEFSNVYLRKIISLITDDPQWYFAITGFFIVTSFLVFIYKYSPNVYLSVMIFFTIGGYFTSHNITRQYIAVAICLYAFSYLISRNPIKYFSLIFIAITFHTSAVVMIPLYFLVKIRINLKIVLLYFILITFGAFLYDFLAPLIHSLIYSDSYIEVGYGTEGASIYNILLPLFLLTFLLYIYYIKKESLYSEIPFDIALSKRNFLINTLLHMGFLSFLIMILSVTNMLILSRLSNYFMISYLIIIPMAINYSSKKLKPLFYFVVIVILVTYFLVSNYLGKLTPDIYVPFWSI